MISNNPKSKRIFDSSAYPNAAGTPESGTNITISALIELSLAKNFPFLFLHSYTFFPSKILSGLAKYIYSNIQGLKLMLLNGLYDFTPSLSITTISPFNVLFQI